MYVYILKYCLADLLESDWAPHVNIRRNPNERELIKYKNTSDRPWQ